MTSPIKVKTFVAYSRVDGIFVEMLCNSLEGAGYDVRIDHSHVRKGEDWWRRIVDLIVESAIVIFIMSPDALESPICQREIDLTAKLGKRIVPVLFRNVVGCKIPEALGEVDWVRFDVFGRHYADVARAWKTKQGVPDRSLRRLESLQHKFDVSATRFKAHRESPAYSKSLTQLLAAMHLDDVLWHEEQGRWLQRAHEWNEAGRLHEYALSQAEVNAVQDWLARRPSAAPALISLHLRASRKKLSNDRDRLRKISGRAFVEPARQAVTLGLDDHALRLLAAGALLADDPDFELVPQLFQAASRIPFGSKQRACVHHSDSVRLAKFTPNGRRVLTATYSSVGVWAADSGKNICRILDEESGASAMTFSPNGTLVAAKCADEEVRLFKSDDGTEVAVRFEDCHDALDLNFSGDNALLAMAMAKSGARIYATHTGLELARLRTKADVRTAELRPGRTEVLSSCVGGVLLLWDAHTGRVLRRFRGDLENIPTAWFSPDGRLIVVQIKGFGLRIFQLDDGCPLGDLIGHDAEVHHVEFAPSLGAVLSASSDGTARIWDSANGHETRCLKGHRGIVWHASWSPDGARIATSSTDNTARIWDAAEGTELSCLTGHQDMVMTAQFSADGQRVLTSSYDGTARIWDSSNGGEISRTRIRFTRRPISVDRRDIHDKSGVDAIDTENCDQGYEIAHSPNWASVAASAGGSKVTIMESHSGREIAHLGCIGEEITAIAFSNDGTRLAIGARPGVIRIWHLHQRKQICEFRGHRGEIASIMFDKRDRHVVSAAFDRVVWVWRARDGGRVRRINLPAQWSATAATFTPDCDRVVVTSFNAEVGIFALSNGIQVGEFRGHDGVPGMVVFSADGRFAVTTCNDSRVRVWRAEGGKPLFSFACPCTHAAFDASARRIVVGCSDGSVRVWDVEKRAELALLEGHSEPVWSVAFSADGRRVFSTSGDLTARLWDVGRLSAMTGDCVAFVCGAIAGGTGRRVMAEGAELLLQDTPVDLHGAILSTWRERGHNVEIATKRLNAAFHAHCYEAPSRRSRIDPSLFAWE